MSVTTEHGTADFVEIMSQFTKILDCLATISTEHVALAQEHIHVGKQAVELRRRLYETVKACEIPSRAQLIELSDEMGTFSPEPEDDSDIMKAHNTLSLRVALLLGDLVEESNGDILQPGMATGDVKSYKIA